MENVAGFLVVALPIRRCGAHGTASGEMQRGRERTNRALEHQRGHIARFPIAPIMAAAGFVVRDEEIVVAITEKFQEVALVADARRGPVGIAPQRLARHREFITADARAKSPVAVASDAVGHRAGPRVTPGEALNLFKDLPGEGPLFP